MLRDIRTAGILSFTYVVADGLYGNSPTFLDAVEEDGSTIFFVSIPSDTRCWLQGPVLEAKQYSYKGEVRAKRVVAQTEKAPMAVEAVAHSLHDCYWYRRKVSEGTKGPIEYEFTKRQVTRCKDGQPDKTVWLVMKRTIGEHPSYWYYISNAPVSARLPLFVWLSGVRWAIEQCFEETKTELGMDQYEIRKYLGWHHHMLTWALLDLPWLQTAPQLTLLVKFAVHPRCGEGNTPEDRCVRPWRVGAVPEGDRWPGRGTHNILADFIPTTTYILTSGRSTHNLLSASQPTHRRQIMLPGDRTEGEVFSIPLFSFVQGDVAGFLHDLGGFHEAFRVCFAGREPRAQFFGYMVGQFSALERKSIEPMALQVEGGNVR